MVGSNLLKSNPEFISSFDFVDILRGNSYLTLNGGYANREGTTYESYTTGEDANLDAVAGNWVAQTFTVGNTGDNVDFWVTHVKLKMSNISTFDLVITIQEVDGTGKPNGTILAQKTLTATEIKGVNDWVTFSLEDGGTAKLEAGTKYAIVLDPNGTTRLRVDDSAPTYTGGNILESGNGGATWTADTGADLMFEVIGSLKNPLTLFTQSFTSVPNSNAILIEASSTELFADRGNLDLDLEINKTATVEGLAIMEVKGALSGTDVWMYYVNEIYHVDSDGVETLLGTAQSTTGYHETSLTLDTTTGLDLTRKRFKRGEILRIRINAYAKLEGFGSGSPPITFTWSDFRALIPFRTFM